MKKAHRLRVEEVYARHNGRINACEYDISLPLNIGKSDRCDHDNLSYVSNELGID